MGTLNDTFDAKLRKKIEEQVEALKDEAVVGIAGDPHRANYRAGQVAGLLSCLGLCDDVQTELNKR